MVGGRLASGPLAAVVRASQRSSWTGRGASWIGSARRTQAFASASSRMARRPGSTRRSSPGPRRPRRTVSAAANGTAPASEATATSRSRVTAKAAGRSPFRSTSAPTRRPSAKTIAAGPSHGARNPAVRRRSVATCGCGARRSASASGIAVRSAGRQVPAGRRQQLEAPRRATANRSRRAKGAGRREQVARRPRERRGVARPAADLLAIAADRVDLAVVGDRAERLGEPPDRVGVRRVALVEDRVRDATRRPQVRVEVGQAATDDEALVDDRPRRSGRDGDARPWRPPAARAAVSRRRRATTSRRSKASSLSGRARRRPGARRPRHDRLGERRPGRRPRTLQAQTRSTGTSRQRSDRQPRLGERRLHERPGPPLDGPAAWQEQRHDRPVGRRGRVAREQLEERAVERQRHAGAVARLAVGPERAAVAQRGQPGKGKRQDPVARPAARVRDEPDAARVVLEPRVVQRSGGSALAGCAGRVHGLSLRRWDGAAAVDCRRRPVRGSREWSDDGRRWESGARVVTLDRQPRRGRTGRGPSPRLRA